MKQISLEALIKEEEEKLLNQLRADDMVDKNRLQSVSRLQDALSRALLRYNAACSGDGMRQAVADSVTAPALDMAGLLLSGTAEKEISKRPVRSWAVAALLSAVVCVLAGALIFPRSYEGGCILMALAAVAAFLSGRLWYGEREVQIRAGIDADVVWKNIDRAAGTMDRKIEALCLLVEQSVTDAQNAPASSVSAQFDADRLKLISDLLEALYADNGSLALQQLKKLRPYLRSRGIDVVDYAPEYEDMFELLPTKMSPATLRPALCSGEKLLLAGRATRPSA